MKPSLPSTTDPRRSASPRAWARGPRRPGLGADEVHVWIADLDSVAEHLDGLLSPDERAEAWTRREAQLKFAGASMSSDARESDSHRDPLIYDLRVGGNAAAALAVKRGTTRISCTAWTPTSRTAAGTRRGAAC